MFVETADQLAALNGESDLVFNVHNVSHLCDELHFLGNRRLGGGAVVYDRHPGIYRPSALNESAQELSNGFGSLTRQLSEADRQSHPACVNPNRHEEVVNVRTASGRGVYTHRFGAAVVHNLLSGSRGGGLRKAVSAIQTTSSGL
ncbi:hypothetical protein PHET_04646 [Paragonimus heterotremus]|uniref:Uncharacterized protein n=1 Tax=Paragonimus heterotremus TaxID=100268 RepID=A0A8J4SQ93_9TREM|nr:hypothetical protein PHET_04646 [Paragonimus heterotremus]